MIPSERAVNAMKINEAEQRVGISRRNIRFYEKEGFQPDGAEKTAVLGTPVTELRYRRRL